jgi:hypothetical protein
MTMANLNELRVKFQKLLVETIDRAEQRTAHLFKVARDFAQRLEAKAQDAKRTDVSAAG